MRSLAESRPATGGARAAALLLGAADRLAADLDPARRTAVCREDRLAPVLFEALGTEAVAAALQAGAAADLADVLAAARADEGIR